MTIMLLLKLVGGYLQVLITQAELLQQLGVLKLMQIEQLDK